MKLSTLFPVYDPSKEAHPQTKFEHFWMQKDTNFGNTMILLHLGPEKHQKSDPERHEFWEHHDSSTPWAREMPKIRPRKTRISGTP